MPPVSIQLSQSNADFIARCLTSDSFETEDEVVNVALTLMARCAHDLAEELDIREFAPGSHLQSD